MSTVLIYKTLQIHTCSLQICVVKESCPWFWLNECILPITRMLIKDTFLIYNYFYPYTISERAQPNGSNAVHISIIFSFYYPVLFNLSWGNLEAYNQCGTRIINALRPMPPSFFLRNKLNAKQCWVSKMFPLKNSGHKLMLIEEKTLWQVKIFQHAG